MGRERLHHYDTVFFFSFWLVLLRETTCSVAPGMICVCTLFLL